VRRRLGDYRGLVDEVVCLAYRDGAGSGPEDLYGGVLETLAPARDPVSST
jgi:hypothetical protein